MPNHAVRTLFLFFSFCVVTWIACGIALGANDSTPLERPALVDRLPSFPEIVRANASKLASLPGQEDPVTFFNSVLGPALGLNDAAMTVMAKGLSPTMTKELMIDELKQTASKLVQGLAAWQVAQAARELGPSTSADQQEQFQRQIETQMDWLIEGTPLEPPLRQLLALSKALQPREPSTDAVTDPARTGEATDQLAAEAAVIETWAVQTVHREWFKMFNWKDQVRQQRGLARLCGTWQWSIHNHQNHREEKTAVIFAPPGIASPTSPAEIIVLGDSLYLRWETKAGVQEDSLLFSGEGQRLEGTFVNTAGGWGSITGKRTAACFPKTGDKPAAGQRRRH
jgi:hypothetical protein